MTRKYSICHFYGDSRINKNSTKLAFLKRRCYFLIHYIDDEKYSAEIVVGEKYRVSMYSDL